jgi:hypothetical protein
MQMPDLVGWIASAILLATLARQTWRQWREPDPRGVSASSPCRAHGAMRIRIID